MSSFHGAGAYARGRAHTLSLGAYGPAHYWFDDTEG